MHVRAMVFQGTVGRYAQPQVMSEVHMVVAGRLAYVNHLPVADASYHYQCNSIFFKRRGRGGGQMPIRHIHVEASIHKQN